MELQTYIAAIKRRWPYLAASIAIICGIVLFHVKTATPVPVYRAVARIFVASSTSSVSADDVAQLAISSRVIQHAFDFLLRPVPESSMSSNEEAAFREVYKFRDPVPVEVMMQRVRSETGNSSTNRSSVVTITAFASNKADAINMVNKVAEYAKEEALGLTQLGVYKQGDYILTQLNEARVKLERAQDARQEFMGRHKNLVIPLSFEDARHMVSELEQESEAAGAAIEENQSRVSALKRTLGTRTSAKIDLNSAPSSAVIERLQAESAAREVELMTLRNKYTEEHPKIKEVQGVLENIKNRLASELRKSYDIGNAPASLEYQFLTGDISRYEAEKLAAQARRNGIERLVRQARNQLAGLPEIESEYNSLNMDYRAARDAYMDLKNKYSQSRLAVSIAEKQREDKMGIGLIDPALTADETPGSKFQKKSVKMAIAFIIALIVGVGLVLFVEGMDTSIRDVDQVEDRYQLPVLGVIPALREAAVKSGSVLVLRDSPNSVFAEPYRIMRANFMALAERTGVRSVIITSTLPGEGKTTTAGNFAASLAEAHKKVILIDADLRNPSLHRNFGVRKNPGLSEYLAEEATLEDVLYPTTIENLLLISAGSIPESPARLISSQRMKNLLEELTQQAEYVVIDTPPAVAFSDAMELGSVADAMILVVGAGSKLESAHFHARTQLANAHAELVGTVLNRVQPGNVDSYRYASGYYAKYNGRDGKALPPATPKEPEALPEAPSEEVEA